jgi:hypothetical protein
MPHTFYTPLQAAEEDGYDRTLYRMVADGGLAVCRVCHCFEGSLPTECPGEPVSAEQQDRIYAGQVDFKDGNWEILAPGGA